MLDSYICVLKDVKFGSNGTRLCTKVLEAAQALAQTKDGGWSRALLSLLMPGGDADGDALNIRPLRVRIVSNMLSMPLQQCRLVLQVRRVCLLIYCCH